MQGISLSNGLSISSNQIGNSKILSYDESKDGIINTNSLTFVKRKVIMKRIIFLTSIKK